MQHNAVGQCILLAALMMISLLAALMIIDMNGPDIEAADEVKALILESVNVWKNYKKRVPSRGRQGARAPRSAHATMNVYSEVSGLEDVSFNDFIKDDFIPEGHGQVTSDSASLPDSVALQTEEQTLKSEQNERDVPETLGEYKCDAGNICRECACGCSHKNTGGTILLHTSSLLGGWWGW